MRRSLRPNRFVLSALMVLVAAPSTSRAYPIFYACEGGRANDHLDTKDIKEKVLSMKAAGKSDSEILDICGGQEECFAVLKQALLLTRASAEIANEVFEALVLEIEARTEKLQADLKVDRSIPETAKNLIVMADAVNECRKEQHDLVPGTFAFKGHAASDRDSGWDIFLQHGVDNEYLFVSGIGRDGKNNRKTNYDAVGTVIQDAIAANVDPYMALAVSYLEAGKPEPFALDPMPAMGLMGCSGTKIGTFDDENAGALAKKEAELRAKGEPFYYNWGTFYGYTPKVSATGATAKFYKQLNDIKDVPSEANAIVSNEPGLACVQNEGTFLAKSNGEIVDAMGGPVRLFSKSKACCMKIPYITPRVFNLMANHALGEKLRNTGGDPANLLQGFNGYGVIGITEKTGVGAFRYGMRMRDQPQYGAQGMDFILNSFMSNPMIREFVRREEENYGHSPKSLICAGKADGTYVTQSDRYVNMQRGMKRLHTVIGKSWSGMTGLERALVRHEYGFVNDLKGKNHPNLSAAENTRFQAAITQMNSLSEEAKWNYYRTNVYPFRDTLGKTSMKSWSRLDDGQILEIREKIKAAPAQVLPD